MAYRPREYVPEVYQPNDGRLSELMYLQGQNQADRAQRAGIAQAALWSNLGRTASGALSELAQYKREAPMRAEAERVRKEKDKLRGLEQMAGAGGMDEEARGKLLKQEGFVEKGQEVLDRQTARKANEASLDWTEKQRTAAEISDAVIRIDQAMKGADGGASVWPSVAEGIKKQYPKLKDLPDTYDPDAIKAYRNRIMSGADILSANDRAEKEVAKALQKETATYQRVAHFKSAIKELGPYAKTAEQWDAMVANIENGLKRLPADEAEAVRSQLNLDKTFSPEGHRRLQELYGEKANTPTEIANRAFVEQHGREPRTLAEAHSVIAAATPPSRTAGGGGESATDRRARERVKVAANTAKNNELYDLEVKYANQEITEEQLAKGKELVQQRYLSQIGAEDGPTLAEYEGQRGRDVLGKPLAAQALPGAARQQGGAAPPAVAPTGDMVTVQASNGEFRDMSREDAEYYMSQDPEGFRIVPRRQQAAPSAGPPAAQPQMGDDQGPQLPTSGRITMRGPRGHIETVNGGDREMFELLEQGWKILPPENDPVSNWAGRIKQDLQR